MIPDSHDEIHRILARLIGEFTKGGKIPPGSGFKGFAIIAIPGGIPAVARISQAGQSELSPDVIEDEHEIFITATLPAGCDAVPTVTFQPLTVGITHGEETFPVNLPSRIDLQGCSWQVKNGVLDIRCRKA